MLLLHSRTHYLHIITALKIFLHIIVLAIPIFRGIQMCDDIHDKQGFKEFPEVRLKRPQKDASVAQCVEIQHHSNTELL